MVSLRPNNNDNKGPLGQQFMKDRVVVYVGSKGSLNLQKQTLIIIVGESESFLTVKPRFNVPGGLKPYLSRDPRSCPVSGRSTPDFLTFTLSLTPRRREVKRGSKVL